MRLTIFHRFGTCCAAILARYRRAGSGVGSGAGSGAGSGVGSDIGSGVGSGLGVACCVFVVLALAVLVTSAVMAPTAPHSQRGSPSADMAPDMSIVHRMTQDQRAIHRQVQTLIVCPLLGFACQYHPTHRHR